MSDFEVFHEAHAMRQFSRQQKLQGRTIALVPTMGNLHAGHISLVEEGGKLADIVVVSIYVNPTQFSKNEDFGVYPKSLEEDYARLRSQGIAAIFQPRTLYHKGAHALGQSDDQGSVVGESELRPGDHETFVQTELLQQPLCGRSRPHFFKGVATVVTKLFNIVEPDVAIFGSKDYQQLQVVTRLAKDLDFCIDIVGQPIVREPDGLAMSSRNSLLSSEDRRRAVAVSKSLNWAKALATDEKKVSYRGIVSGVTQEICKSGGRIDYVEVVEARTLARVDLNQLVQPGQAVLLVAVFYGSVRLIDNLQF